MSSCYSLGVFNQPCPMFVSSRLSTLDESVQSELPSVCALLFVLSGRVQSVLGLAVCSSSLDEFSQPCHMFVINLLSEPEQKRVEAGESCASPFNTCVYGTVCDTDLICSKY